MGVCLHHRDLYSVTSTWSHVLKPRGGTHLPPCSHGCPDLSQSLPPFTHLTALTRLHPQPGPGAKRGERGALLPISILVPSTPTHSPICYPLLLPRRLPVCVPSPRHLLATRAALAPKLRGAAETSSRTVEGQAERKSTFLSPAPHCQGLDSPGSTSNSTELPPSDMGPWLDLKSTLGQGRAQKSHCSHFPRDMLLSVLCRKADWCAQGVVPRELGGSTEPGEPLRESEGQAFPSYSDLTPRATLMEPQPMGALVIKGPKRPYRSLRQVWPRGSLNGTEAPPEVQRSHRVLAPPPLGSAWFWPHLS